MKQPLFPSKYGPRRVGVPHVEWLDPNPKIGKQRGTLADVAADDVRFEDALPVRRLPAYQGQGHYPGWLWCATNDRHVGHESKLEGRVLTTLDFDPNIVGISSQPFVLWLPGDNGTRAVRHTPDFFTVTDTGTVRVIEVKSPGRDDAWRTGPKYQRIVEAFAEVGWTYEVRTEPSTTEYRVADFLHGYAHEIHRRDDIADELLAACNKPRSWMDLCEQVGPLPLVTPTLWHLCWWRDLTIRTDTIPTRFTHIYPTVPDHLERAS